MTYRTRKRKAAVWILKEIIKPRVRVTGLRNFDGRGSYEEINTKYYVQYKLKDLISKNVYSKELLRDAVDMLVKNKHVEVFENVKNVYDIGVRVCNSGEMSLKDNFYQDEIYEYRNNKIYSWTKIWLPILAILISLISLFISIFYRR